MDKDLLSEEFSMRLLDKTPRLHTRAAAALLTLSLLMFSARGAIAYSFAAGTGKNGLASVATEQPNISGVWTGEMMERDANGDPRGRSSLYLRLERSRNEIKGVIGETESTASPIDNVVLTGNHLKFSAHAGGGPKGSVTWVLDLDIQGDEMTGKAHALRSADNHSWDAEATFSRH